MQNTIQSTFQIIAPISGKTMDLKNVPDPVFADKLTGDGLAIIADGDYVLAPCDGIITLFFTTKHAFAITADNGIQVLVHVGLDTVILDGRGFTALHITGDRVLTGTPILKLDRPFIKAKGMNLITPVLIVNYEKVTELNAKSNSLVEAGKTPVIEYML
jgi:PTS system D-glucosamine-specific IIA component/PTS system glucose-specific IIA component